MDSVVVTKMSPPSTIHPYYPRDLDIPNYVPNTMNEVEILGVFFGIVSVICVLTWWLAGSRSQTKGVLTRLKLCWFANCFLIHGILEGYFSIYHKTFPGGNAFLAQVWKEYGKGDSRYITGDSFTVCMETITAFVDGPLSAMALYAFLQNKPYRHVTQLVLSLCQLYGDVLYFSTEFKDGCTHGPMYHPVYFWFYFIFMNIIWIIIPSMCLFESWRAIVKSQQDKDAKEVGKKTH